MRGAEEIVWAGGANQFRLAIGELRTIEQRCNAGVSVVLMRLLGQQWGTDDVVQPILLGLTGAGMSEGEAKRCLDRAYSTSNLYGLAINAAAILQKFIMWDPDGDVPGEPQAGAVSQTQTRSQTDAPSGQPTTAQEPF
ncbi:gene transfer agent family protein [Sinorhizobium meliloti]|uniref:gene transfer agent family protein n=1 Tax=Rhizobium meliloti TaxID=382 RepID=UPI00067F57D3|nr:gene transfer agent family protein [Sinorhizobium meliloti]